MRGAQVNPAEGMQPRVIYECISTLKGHAVGVNVESPELGISPNYSSFQVIAENLKLVIKKKKKKGEGNRTACRVILSFLK